jgi:NADP-dependent 3-hydroxy acid dehydrogenase YdfG
MSEPQSENRQVDVPTQHTLQGRKALLTGGTSGIGAATADALVRAGVDVAVTGRRTDRLQSLVNDLTVLGGGRPVAFELDVTDERSVRDVVEDAAAALGGLDLLVNNAGVMLVGPFNASDSAQWQRMLSTNVLGTVAVTHAALPHLQAADRVADVVNMSSVAGRVAYAGSAVYNATKFAVNGFSEALRQELTGTGVRVTVIEPGMVATELTSHVTDPAGKAQVDAYYASMPILQAEDVADAVVYAVSRPPHGAVAEILFRPTGQQVP